MTTASSGYSVRRLGPGDAPVAKALFEMMAAVFEEECKQLSDGYVGDLLASQSFWALAVTDHQTVVGGLTAHVLPLTRAEVRELFIYDVAVAAGHQRRGVGRLLMDQLRRSAKEAGLKPFVLVDNEDAHALEFYRALGGSEAAVTSVAFED